MDDFATDTHTERPLLRLAFRARSYDESARQDLHRRLEDVADVTLEPVPLPEAGGDAEVVATLTFLGASVVGGVVGNAAYDAIKAICRKLGEWWRDRANSEIFAPQFVHVEVAFQDISIVFVDERHAYSPDIYFMNDRQVEQLPELCRLVVQTFPPGLLSQRGVRRIELPVSELVGEQSAGAELGRYWDLQCAPSEPELIFDSWRGVVGLKPTEAVRVLPDLAP